ncbi:MAG: hypothetical protein HOE30_16160 [Deltaproteobacteria bacterium]|jgi:hypothetical protein|nr:hypothetical protein [Deltaproteobacteria bacterium]MBT4263833.1 hypothetical protein [Deltaproteobacteria bacterium]MBT7152955.1 hypothetical protein [Deltaproteobacteria bacterium]MBT7712590.1 hypothetical protein [Deltaproteobacteria bacterium]
MQEYSDGNSQLDHNVIWRLTAILENNMPEFSLLQTVMAVGIIAFFVVFYLRRSWFWFWKVTKLFKQFEDLERITASTNREVKELNRKVSELIAMLEKQK